MKKIIALIVACLLAVSIFAGCGGSSDTASTEAADAAATEAADAAATEAATEAAADGETADITGVWVTTDFIDAEGNTYTLEDYAKANGVEAESITVTYTFGADGSAACGAAGTSVDGTYTFDGTTVKTTFEAASPTFEYDAERDLLTNSEDASGVVSVLARVKD